MKYLKKLFCALIVFAVLLAGCQAEEQPGQQECMHIDQNADELCDTCGTDVVVNVDFYVINDLHGKICDSSQQPGVDELTTYLKAAQFTDENVVLLSSGDMWQGSSESNLTDGLIVTEWMNEMDFTSMTMGNHEYDWGESVILKNYEIAEFPFLAINIYSRQSNELVEYCQPSVMIEKGGAKIGIIGAIGDCYSSIASDHTKEIYFLTGNDLTELVKAEAQKLRDEGADFILYSLHDGFGGRDYSETVSDSQMSAYYDIALSEGYVDVVFEAHTHQYYVKEDTKGIYHLQGGGDNTGITHFEVDINTANDTYTVNQSEYLSTDTYSSMASNPLIDELLEKYDEQVSAGYEVLGKNKDSRSKNELRSLAAQLYYDYGMELWGDEYDIVLAGGFFTVRSPGYLTIGNVTYSQLQMIFPFDNFLTLCSVSGADLVRNFIETDNSNYFIAYGEYGEQIIDNIDPNETYYIVVDSYTSTYKYNNLTEIHRYEERVFLRDLMAEYVRNGGFE